MGFPLLRDASHITSMADYLSFQKLYQYFDVALGLVAHFAEALLIVAAGWWISLRVASVVQRALLRVGSDTLLVQPAKTVTLWLIRAVVAVVALGQLGVQTASILAVFGAAGLAIGLALQGTLQNIAASFMLMALRPFKVNDLIELDGSHTMGTVNHVGLFATEITRIDGIRLFMPNSKIWGAAICNYTANGVRRMDITIGLSYGSPIPEAMEAIVDLLAADSSLLPEYPPVVAVDDYADSSVMLKIRIWTRPEDYWAVRWRTLLSVRPVLEEIGCSFPYPTREIRIVGATQADSHGAGGALPGQSISSLSALNSPPRPK